MKSDMENKDWLNDCTSLKQVNPANPFTVPVGYFDDLGDRIVSAKNLDELKNNNVLGDFKVPENYFEELAGNIQSRIAIEEILSNEGDFTVPEGYFDNLEKQIQSRISIEKTLGSPVEEFIVPEGYFDELHNDILNKTVNAGNTNRKGIVRRIFVSTAFKYATAACFAIAIGGGILLNEVTNTQMTAHKNTFLHKQLSKVPVDEIKNYLQLNLDAGDTQQNVTTEGTPVNEADLKDALQNYVDSVQ